MWQLHQVYGLVILFEWMHNILRAHSLAVKLQLPWCSDSEYYENGSASPGLPYSEVSIIHLYDPTHANES